LPCQNEGNAMKKLINPDNPAWYALCTTAEDDRSCRDGSASHADSRI
jgi:hypothetical protein